MMQQRVIRDWPPNHADIIARFGDLARNPRVLFSWGDRLYFPDPFASIHPALIAHERTHGARQTSDESAIRAWWSRYLADRQFRAEEELLAHRVEWRALETSEPDRNRRARIRVDIAKRLSSELYDLGINFGEAMAALRA